MISVNFIDALNITSTLISYSKFKVEVKRYLSKGEFDSFIAELLADEIDRYHDNGFHGLAHELDSLLVEYCALAND